MDLNSHGDQILTNILDNFELSLKHGADEDKNPEKCKAMAKRICKIEHDYFLERDAIKEAAKQPSIESFDSALEDYERPTRAFQPENSKRYTDFVKKLDRLIKSHNNQDNSQLQDSLVIDEDISTQGGIYCNDIDPLTKGPLENPVRNRICNHVYGKQTVMLSIQKNPRLRCPIMGCPNKTFVKLNDLVEDVELAERLKEQRRRNRN